MTATTTQRRLPVGAFISNVDGQVICCHRSLSCCPECFDSVPGLIDVYTVVYPFLVRDWDLPTLKLLQRGVPVEGLRLSAGTVVEP